MRHPIHQQQWLEYLDGTLPQTVAAQFRRHLDDCPECRRTAEGLCACQHEITREAARLTASAALTDRQLDRMLAGTLARIRAHASEPAVRPAAAWTVSEALLLLRSLLEPICGFGTARAAVRLAVRAATANGRTRISASNWGQVVSRLSETVGSICGIAAARLIARAGLFVVIEDPMEDF